MDDDKFYYESREFVRGYNEGYSDGYGKACAEYKTPLAGFVIDGDRTICNRCQEEIKEETPNYCPRCGAKMNCYWERHGRDYIQKLLPSNNKKED